MLTHEGTSSHLASTASPLRVYRVAAGLTQAELARAAGLERRTVSRLEHGRHRPFPGTARALADALSVDADLLFGGCPDGP